MTQKTIPPYDRAALVGVIDPDAYAAAAYSTGWIDMRDFQEILALLEVGDIVATGTVDAKLEQAQDGTGTGVKDIANAAITQLTAAGGDSNKQAVIQAWSEDLDVDNAFTHARLTVTLGTAGADMGAAVLGMCRRIGKASDGDLASVAEVVSTVV